MFFNRFKLVSLVIVVSDVLLSTRATTNKEKPLYIPILIISLIICIGAIILAFKGLQIILDSIFYKINDEVVEIMTIIGRQDFNPL